MPADIKEMEKKFSDLSVQVDTMRKDFELKLDTAQKEAQTWKANAEKRENELKEFREQAEKAKQEADVARVKVRSQEIRMFAGRIKSEGKIAPAHEDMVVKIMESMTSDAVIMTSKSQDGSMIAHTQFSLFMQLLEKLPKMPVYGELTYGGLPHSDIPNGDEPAAEQFMEVLTKNGGRQKLPVRGADVHQAAEKHMEEMRVKGIVVSYADALLAVSSKKRVPA